MGHINDAFYFVAPAYLVTFAAFAALAVATIRHLSVWARRARDEDEQRGTRDSEESERAR